MGLSGYQPSHPSSWVYQAYTNSGLHLDKIHMRHSQANRWVYQDTKEVERLTAKVVSSIREIWTPTLDLALILNIFTPNIRKHPLLCYIVPQAMPSLLVLFRVCKEDN